MTSLGFVNKTQTMDPHSKDKRHPRKNGLAIALGGGGAKGLAHIPLLEVVDTFDFKVQEVAGTSIGALIGALYAGGMPGSEIRKVVTDLLQTRKAEWRSWIANQKTPKWYNLVGPNVSGKGFLKLDRILTHLDKNLPIRKFEDLEIPLKIVSTNFWTREQVVFETGDILTAIHASISIAGLFPPVVLDGKIYVDGGAVNPVPFDILNKNAYVMAFDVLGYKIPPNDRLYPGLFEALFNTYQIMEESIVKQKLHNSRPDFYLKPDLRNIRVLDFHKFPEVIKQSTPATELLYQTLTQLSEQKDD